MEVWPEQWDALRLFLSAIGQFEVAVGMASIQYRPARSVNLALHMDWLGIRGKRHQAEVWAQYQVMEMTAIQVMNARATG